MIVLKCFLVVKIIITSVSSSYERKEDLKNATNSRYFEDVFDSPFFVDKTLLIKEFLNLSKNKSSTVVRVLTPPKFGKTINNNMIKRFLEVIVNDKGELQDVKQTSNFKLFSKNNLHVFRDEIFQKDFGKHPVITINCTPLKQVTNFDHMIDIYRDILRLTFSEHKYLLSVDKLWQDFFNKSSFELYFDENHDNRLHKYYIFCGFTILSEVLHVHFGKTVYVLVDDFDAIEDCPAYVTGEDKRRIFNFVKEVENDLLLDNEHLAAALLVGSLRKKKKDEDKRFENKFECSPTLWKHYGLSKEELKLLLSKFIKDVEEQEKAVVTIIKEFSGVPQGYNGTVKHQLCSMTSLDNYFAMKKNVVY